MKIRLAGIANDSIVDGPGIRYTIFVQGCPHKCKGCHNQHTHDYNGGFVKDINDLLKEIKANPLLCGVTFSGGEPFCQAKELAYLGEKIKQNDLDIVITSYSIHYTKLYEQIINIFNKSTVIIVCVLIVTTLAFMWTAFV